MAINFIIACPDSRRAFEIALSRGARSGLYEEIAPTQRGIEIVRNAAHYVEVIFTPSFFGQGAFQAGAAAEILALAQVMANIGTLQAVTFEPDGR